VSAQLTLTASHSEPKSATCLQDWPLPSWQTITPPRVTHYLRYLRLQQSAAHWKNRQCDLVLCLLQLYSEEQAGINHRTRIVRLERLTRRARARLYAVLAALEAAEQGLNGSSAQEAI